MSLDDADIVAFGLPITPFATRFYRGKPSLSEDQSFRYKELLHRWRRELLSAVNAGKTVFVQLTSPQIVYVATGEVKRSGTGRNATRTQIVALQSNIEALPCKLEQIREGFGEEIRVAPRAQFLSRYWKRFADLSWYEMRFSSQDGLLPLLTTRNQEQIVGAMFVSKNGGGHLILLPGLQLRAQDDDEDADRGTDDDNADDNDFRQNSIDYAKHLFEIDQEFRKGAPSPPPDWMKDSQYETTTQEKLRKDLLRAQAAEAQSRQRTEELKEDLEDAGQLQGLLFAQGKQLEDAVIRALKVMGVEAIGVAEGDSEFDAIFTIDGRRVLGEVEGRDSAAINIDKITQLERNVAEDFAREETTEHAHGVLFGNPERLVSPDKRERTFTQKCMTSAKRNGFALVLTHKMFEAVRYIEATGDLDYAAKCRDAIIATRGVVVEFPSVPA
ncbi:MAG: hypothetical protein OXC55_02835 [Chloroflexi bacterium]|nr:hypothetical protein [Chloroflexota bacterium]